MLTLGAFGALDLRDAEGAPVGSVLAQSKRAALLAYLVLSRPGAFHRRDSLLVLFWPESDQAHARSALSQALTFLRREVGESVILTRGNDEVGVDPERVQCDVLAFEEALERGDWAEALELHQGDFLDGLHVRGAPEFAGWVDRERVRLREATAGAVWKLAHKLIRDGSPVEAERTAQRALDLVPTDESPVREFIEALAVVDRGAALRFYQKFEVLLRVEVGVGPAPETEELARAVRRGEVNAVVPVGVVSDGNEASAESPSPLMKARKSPGSDGIAGAPIGPPRGARRVRSRTSRGKALIYLGVVILASTSVAILSTLRQEGGSRPVADIRPRIAVLPCENLSLRPEDAYYADGLHDAIITRLGMASGVVPSGRSSVLGYKGQERSPAQIAQELNVEYLGECSVLKEEHRIQVRFRLLEADSGTLIWAGLFDEELEMGGIIAAQSEITRRVVEGLGRELTGEEQARIAAIPTSKLGGYELYMIGRNRFYQRTPENLRDAIDYFEAATVEDPTFALAYSGLGMALVYLPLADLSVPTAEVRERARAAVTRAYELDPGAGAVQASMGLFLHFLDWDWAAAELHHLEAVRLSPGDVFTHQWYASMLSIVGRVEEAVEETRLVLAMDPQSSGVIWASGDRLWQAGHVGESRSLYERSAQMEPPIPWAFHHLALTYALEEPVDRVRAAESMSRFVSWFGYPYPERAGPLVEALGGEPDLREEAVRVLDDIAHLTVLKRTDLLFCYVKVAPPDLFFDILGEAVRVRHVWVPWIPVSMSRLAPEILNDPRWTEFLIQIGHPGIGNT